MIDPTLHPEAEKASIEAVEKTKEAQEAVEHARREQIKAQNIEQTNMMIEALKAVFGNEGDEKDPEQMTVLVRRIPILCTNISEMHKSIDGIHDNIRWAVRIVLGAVILGVLALLIK